MNVISAFLLNLMATIGDPLVAGLPLELVDLVRTFVGGVLGLLIGFERSRRQKEAGIATHFVVGCAATLFTCLSIHLGEVGDGARIAAQVVSGIGFLGAGMIFFRRESLRGLTTAAGIWATAAIGMCAALGLYWVALGTTAIIILFQIVLHSRLVKRKHLHLLLVKLEYSDDIKQEMMEYFGFSTFHRFKVTTTTEKFIPDATGKSMINDPETEETSDTVEVTKKLIAETVIYPIRNCSADEIAAFIRKHPEILSVERLEDL